MLLTQKLIKSLYLFQYPALHLVFKLEKDPFADLWCNDVIYLQSEPVFCLSSKKQTTSLSNTVKTLEKTQADMEKRLSVLQEEHQRDTSQLEQGNSRIKELQKEVIPTIVENESRTAWDSLAGMSQKSSAPKKRPGPWIHSVCVCVCYWLGSLLLMKGFYPLSLFLSQYEEIQSELSGLREKFENVEEEKGSISLELQQSQERLRLLQDKDNHVSFQSM